MKTCGLMTSACHLPPRFTNKKKKKKKKRRTKLVCCSFSPEQDTESARVPVPLPAVLRIDHREQVVVLGCTKIKD